MKHFIRGSVLLLLALALFPLSADAFSRRSHHSEVTPSQQTTALNNPTQKEGGNVSAQAVAEPPALLLLTVGVGLLALYAASKRIRRQA